MKGINSKMFDLRIQRRLLPKDIQLEACGSRVENLKQSSQQRQRQFSELLRCLKMWECLSEERCSQMRVAKCLLVSPT